MRVLGATHSRRSGIPRFELSVELSSQHHPLVWDGLAVGNLNAAENAVDGV